ncbi:MAG TPA: 3-oxoacyl-ACP reductase FabG [Candidatus Polarisedimenticolaceae bacterium]|nr:3-oxoacyl-ACP reductase FabG [Candidatus Polarisedimenticolaceae bacterium]
MTGAAEHDGRVALVTGASRGIGRAIAVALAERGAFVLCAARSASAGAETVAAIEAAGGRARAVALDVSSDASVEPALKELLREHATIPLLVNNAGITRDNLLMRMKSEDWNAVIDTNLTGLYRLCRAVVPSMVKARFGRIVSITSVVAHIGNAGQANYAASKAGMEGFTRSLARELASRNVTVNCVAPGFIDTDMTKALGDGQREALLSQVPLGRLGTPEDVASAVTWLMSPGASYVTGITLDVNGGMAM